jgi:hypothetical protein
LTAEVILRHSHEFGRHNDPCAADTEGESWQS